MTEVMAEYKEFLIFDVPPHIDLAKVYRWQIRYGFLEIQETKASPVIELEPNDGLTITTKHPESITVDGVSHFVGDGGVDKV